MEHIYSLREIKDGTGFRKDTKFIEIGPNRHVAANWALLDTNGSVLDRFVTVDAGAEALAVATIKIGAGVSLAWAKDPNPEGDDIDI